MLKSTERSCEVRDPIHGFVHLDAQERAVVDLPCFQRLRRIRQLAWTDLVYPGAMHTRFEHSIGVMHVAGRLYDALIMRSEDILRSDYGYDPGTLHRQRKLIRLAALLHDIGHTPFSHAGEELLPINKETSLHYSHEEYSGEIIRAELKPVVEDHQLGRRHGLRLEEVLAIFSSKPKTAGDLIWKNIVAGQMDADRMDYLLRDAHHAGVQYGRYDLDRVINTVKLCEDPEAGGHQIGIGEDGAQAVEGLLIARYMMFTQLYFHKTRVIYDYHLSECMKALLRDFGGTFPSANDIAAYLDWDDWRVLGLIASNEGGEHGDILKHRKHFRLVHETPQVPEARDIEELEMVVRALADMGCVVRDATKSWYKVGGEEILVNKTSGKAAGGVPLSTLSPVVKAIRPVNQKRVYTRLERRDEAAKLIRDVIGRDK